MKKASLILFVLVSLGELVSSIIPIPILHATCKPLLLITLMIYYVSVNRELNQLLSPVVILALVFSWGGDVLLMFTGERFFIFGLISFLIAHVFYIFAFRQFRVADDTNALHGLQKVRFGFPILLYGTGLVVILYPHLDDLSVPVLMYALVLTFMVLNALFRYQRTTTPSFTMVFGGAILFMISDSLLAINKFIEPLSGADFWIMSTYISAQFLIVLGLLGHYRD